MKMQQLFIFSDFMKPKTSISILFKMPIHAYRPVEMLHTGPLNTSPGTILLISLHFENTSAVEECCFKVRSLF